MPLALVLRDLERDVRVELAVGGDAVNGYPGCRMDADANHALLALLEKLHVARHVLEGFHRGLHAVANVGAGGGEADAAPRTLEQAHAELLLEPVDRLRERGLCDVELLGRVGHVLAFGYGEEVFQLKQFHGCSNSITD